MAKGRNEAICALSQDEFKKIMKETRMKLAAQQQVIKNNRIPVLVLMEGWGAAGKGTLISYLIRDLDPRFFRVVPMKPPTKEEKRKPFLWRHISQIPESGKFVFMDSGWMEETVNEVVDGKCKKKQQERRYESIRTFERQLTDNGYLVLKVFVDVSAEEQEERIEKLLDNDDTKWRVSKRDLDQLRHRRAYEKQYCQFMKETNTKLNPWHVIDSSDKALAELQVCRLLIDGIEKSVADKGRVRELTNKEFPLLPMPKLSEIPLDVSLSEEAYEKQLEEGQKRLKQLHNKLYKKGIPVVVAYEGWDAAGKGGNIKRLTGALDARGFEVHPIAAPEPHELSRHYLWRFWTRLPKAGHVAIFDRTWYGRVMVERLEGLCSEDDWKRAYQEINEFEAELSDWGAVILKFWIQIDKDTQLARFEARRDNPEKQWKLTDEDWRNREKWDVYEEAVDEMIAKTSTTYAPWHVIQSNDKYFARIQAMQYLITAIEEKLRETESKDTVKKCKEKQSK